MSFRGIDIRQVGSRILFRAFLASPTGVLLATGTTVLRIYELASDGTLKSYDFNDNTFKTTALTTATLAMAHRTGNNATVNTGIWTVALTTVTGFTPGNIYFAHVNNASAGVQDQMREFQYGGTQDDLAVFGSVSDASPAVGNFDGDSGLSATDDFYNNAILVFLTGTNKGIAREISDYVGASRNFQFTGAAGASDAPWTTVMANGDQYMILGRAGS